MIKDFHNLALDSDTMCFFVDESGVSSLSRDQNVFCLAGCAVHSSQFPILEKRWEHLMLRLFGKANHVFHASGDSAKNLSKQQQQKIFDFFKNPNLD